VTQMSVSTAILTRRTAHWYRPDPVPEEVLHGALACATRAPNHKLTNPWRFTRVGPVTRAAIVELAVEVKRDNGRLTQRQAASVREKVSSAPELFIVTQVLEGDEFRRREDYAACACAIQNFCLSLWADGVHSKWATGAVTRVRKLYELAGIDPAVEQTVGFVWVGYADEQPGTPRRPVSDILRTTS